MIGNLLKLLSGSGGAALSQADERLALTTLLVRIARSDGDYAAAEVHQIEAIIANRFSLDHAAALVLRREAEMLEEAAPDTVRFTRQIKEHVPYESRIGVVEAAWDVVWADGERAHEEDALMRLIANLLGVSDRDSNLARLRALKSRAER